MQENKIGMINFTALKYTRYHRTLSFKGWYTLDCNEVQK